MKDTEKKRIAELRKLGYGYKRISDEIGMSVNAIRNYCSRLDSTRACKECGKPIKDIPGKKKKKFCSDRCRFAWWNKHRDELNHKVSKVVICACCGKEFAVFANLRRVYCSAECYDKARCKGGKANG